MLIKDPRDVRFEQDRKRYDQASAWFTEHVLLHRHDGGAVSSYVVGRPGSSAFRVEVYVGARSITVQGDIDLMSFTGGPPDHLTKIAWLASARGSYLVEKASIGCSSQAMINDHDDDLARCDLLWERRRGFVDREQAQAAWEALCGGEGAQAASARVQDAGYVEGIDLGHIVSGRVIVAHVAVQCLDRLLAGV
jgi:hypothetical protein